MNAQIGDAVLVFDVYGTAYAAIVTSIGDNLTIGCASFMHDGTLRPIKQLPHKSGVMQGFSCNFWDFRPSQKEPPIPEPPRNLSEVLKDALKNIDVEITDEKSIEKLIEERYGRDLEIKKQGIKLHSSWAKPPTEGTFEWALVALKNGHKMPRSWWYEQVILARIEGSYLRFVSDGFVYLPNSMDLSAIDWVLA